MFLRRILAVGAVILLWPTLALPHAQLEAAEPRVGGTVRGPPAQVEITFSEAVEPRFSSIAVTDSAGRRVDRGDVHVIRNDSHHLAVSLPPLGPGEYRVEWHALSVDTHRTEGAYSFTVAP